MKSLNYLILIILIALSNIASGQNLCTATSVNEDKSRKFTLSLTFDSIGNVSIDSSSVSAVGDDLNRASACGDATYAFGILNDTAIVTVTNIPQDYSLFWVDIDLKNQPIFIADGGPVSLRFSCSDPENKCTGPDDCIITSFLQGGNNGEVYCSECKHCILKVGAAGIIYSDYGGVLVTAKSITYN
jgi:hypothetical protein